ncbi:right-handed parallel beta-helix repeat-containing protein [Nonomuraea sp. NPDC000554]|uniref:right-handed parallel beta-helix repeat-containing protein n=1 Tax=Nonomuraea sp. NPDC000554 TaxID=3154259 RepID=UPI0033251BD2
MNTHFTPQAAAAIATVAATGIAVVLPAIPLSKAVKQEPGTGARRGGKVEAVCANDSGDAKTLQEAIDSSGEGDEIVFKGPCLIDATITLLDHRTYRGVSKAGATIKQADGANLPAMLASESWAANRPYGSETVRIEQLTLDGNRDHNTGTVGLMLRSWNSRVEDVDILGAPSDGIRVSNPSKNGTPLKNTMVNSIISDVYIEGSGGAGVRVLDPGNSVTDWVLERSWIADSGTSAVELDNAAGWTLNGLHVYGVRRNAIDAHRCFGTSIVNNYVEDFGGEGSAGRTYYGIRCDLQGEAASVVSDNKIHNFPPLGAAARAGQPKALGQHARPSKRSRTDYVYLALDQVNYGVGHAAVTGNTILGHGTGRETGILYGKGQGRGMSVTSTGNLVDSVGVPRAAGRGVQLGRDY